MASKKRQIKSNAIEIHLVEAKTKANVKAEN